MPEPQPPRRHAPPGRRLQFSLRGLLALVAALSIALAWARALGPDAIVALSERWPANWAMVAVGCVVYVVYGAGPVTDLGLFLLIWLLATLAAVLAGSVLIVVLLWRKRPAPAFLYLYLAAVLMMFIIFGAAFFVSNQDLVSSAAVYCLIVMVVSSAFALLESFLRRTPGACRVAALIAVICSLLDYVALVLLVEVRKAIVYFLMSQGR